MSIGVAIVDDHLMFRQGLRALLAQQDGIDVVVEAAEANEAAEKLKDKHADVVVVDVVLPGSSGITLTRMLAQDRKKVLMLSMHTAHDYVRQAFQAGAKGYAFKNQSIEQLVEAIRSVAAGDEYLAPSVPKAVLTGVAENGERTPLTTLSPRERDVFDLLVQLKTNKQISDALGISVKTVETHRININRKLDVHSTAQLIRYAAINGIVSP